MDYQKLELSVRVVAVLISVISLVIAFIANKRGGKWKKIASNAVQTADSVNSYTHVLIKYIQEANAYEHYDGKEKFSQVIVKFMLYCLNNGIKFDEDQITKEINELVDFMNTEKHVEKGEICQTTTQSN